MFVFKSTRNAAGFISQVPEPMLREALIHVWSWSRLMRQSEGEEHVRLQEVVVLEQVFWGRLCSDWREGYLKVDERLRQAVRASSAVEGVNSVVRMHQGRHRHVSQSMLDLKTTVLEWSRLSSWQAQRGLSL